MLVLTIVEFIKNFEMLNYLCPTVLPRHELSSDKIYLGVGKLTKSNVLWLLAIHLLLNSCNCMRITPCHFFPFCLVAVIAFEVPIVLHFNDRGIVYSARAYKVPECSRTAAGTPLIQILSLSDGERITSIIPVSEFSADQYLLMLTMNGYIKKVSLNFFSSIRSTGIIAIQLVPGDELKWVRCCTNNDLVAMASQNGMVILSACANIRALGRNTRGSVAMRLKGEDKMACMDIIPATMGKDFKRMAEAQQIEDLETTTDSSQSLVKASTGPWLLFVSESGFGKRVPLSRFRLSPLNRTGLIGYKFASEDCLAAVFVVGFSVAEDGESDEQVVLVSQSGTVNRIKVRDVSIQSRFARGVILMRLEHAGKIQSASLISATETEPEEVEAADELHLNRAAAQ
ncbi:DNA gyrase/topoisomerase IV, subunit A, C-terminal repeat [Dillenia turbinata]|uniref:DNA gyrase/topoisomerase IV, subunit A, C-terminal repeat n=1 Tax=Dillenia turbinata TaxID=194707 RepID=A0AAN8V5W1_9MAGN